MGTTDQTPVERKAEARAVVVMASARRQTYGTVDDELRIALDEFERACIAEAVAKLVRDLPGALRFAQCRDPDKATEAVHILGRLLTDGRE